MRAVNQKRGLQGSFMKKHWLLVFLCTSCVGFFGQQLFAVRFATGADQFVKEPEKYVKGKTIGVLCDKASVVGSGKNQKNLTEALVTIARKKKLQCTVGALFVPEYGFDATRGAFTHIEHERSALLSCPIFSLHGEVKKPTPKMLEGLNLMVIDLQEMGVRCFTYISTMIAMLEAAAENKIPVLLLDRPNPIAQWGKVGAGVPQDKRSFLAKIDVPFIHGMTLGEIAVLANKTIGAQLQVIAVRGDQRAALRYLGKNFVPPSPNLTNLRSVFCYPLTVSLEQTNYSEGRGTDAPFEQFGAPWIDEQFLAKNLNDLQLAGVVFDAVTFTPVEMLHAPQPKHGGLLCHGVRIKFADRDSVKPLEVAHHILVALFSLYPQQSSWLKFRHAGYGIDVVMAGDAWRLGVENRVKEREAGMKKDRMKKKSPDKLGPRGNQQPKMVPVTA